MADQMVMRFRQKAKRSFEGSATEEMKRDSRNKTQLGKVAQFILVMGTYPADHTIGTGRDFQQVHIIHDRHHALLAGNGLAVRAAPGMPSDLVDAVLHLVIHAQGKLFGKLMGLVPTEVAVVLGVGLEHVRRLLCAGHERLSRALT